MNILNDAQLQAVAKMSNGCILNGGVGSGKSRTSIYYYFKECGGGIIGGHKKMTAPRDLYIITTASKRDKREWECELALFAMSTDPSLNYYKNKIVVDSWNNIKKYKDITGAFFIFDEDRVTGSGVWVKTFLNISRKNHWIINSATPGDSWEQYIPVFVANGFYKNKTAFCEEHAVYSKFTKFPCITKYINTSKLINYRNRILIDINVVRDTIPHHKDVICDYDMCQYKYVQKHRWNIYKDEPITQASQLCYVLRRVMNEDESRVTNLLKLCEKHKKIIVFYNFDYELDIFRTLPQRARVLGINSDIRDFTIGEWNGHNHEPVPDTDKWLYLVQYAAGCEGWNCIKTDTIVFYSQTYSWKTLAQACGRIDRLNSPFVDLYYYHFKAKSGIDLVISNALRNKKNFNEGKFAKF